MAEAIQARSEQSSQPSTGYMHDIIVIGASAGGVEALSQVVRGLSVDLAAAVFVVLHIPPEPASHLPEILSRQGPLPASHAQDHERIEQGHIYIAQPDRHLLLDGHHVLVSRGPKENRFRPAVDPLFRSAAFAYGPRVVGVVLTGALDDGTAGLWEIKHQGGVAVVQDPREAAMAGMPKSALEYVEVDHCLTLDEIGPLLGRLAHEAAPVPEPAASTDRQHELTAYLASMMSRETRSASNMDVVATQNTQRGGTLAGYVCPECNGPLWEMREGKLVRFRCRVGHAFSRETMLVSQNEALDEALWTAYETLSESVLLAERFAAESHARGQHEVADHLEERARLQRQRAEHMRDIIDDAAREAPLDDSAVSPSRSPTE